MPNVWRNAVPRNDLDGKPGIYGRYNTHGDFIPTEVVLSEVDLNTKDSLVQLLIKKQRERLTITDSLVINSQINVPALLNQVAQPEPETKPKRVRKTK